MTACLLLLVSAANLSAQSRPKALFYMTETTASVQSFVAHANKVDILVPTWYSVDDSGLVWGGPDEYVMQVARQHHVPVMPIIINTGAGPGHNFHQENFHKLIANPEAGKHLIETIVAECKNNGYAGFQFDFENILWTDRDALTKLVSDSAAALHAAGFQLSVATVPNAPGYPGEGQFARWIYAEWRGAYDLEAIAKVVDLVCLMTYDQHTSYTPPGPVAGMPWTMENLEYALKIVPKEKLSLGIPLYGYRWFAGEPSKDNKPAETALPVGAAEVQELLARFHPQVQWDANDHATWFYFYRDQMREWVFYTDARTFADRYDVVKQRGLQGFCSWVLGQEDPAIWAGLPSHE